MQTLQTIYHDTVPPLLAELADTPPMLRLKQVGMNCGCEYTAFPRFRRGKQYNRWLHSLGVGLIVWHFTEDPAQAAAGLLHDVATPTFAHVVDFLRGDYLTQEATEDGTAARIDGSPEIQTVLARYGLTTELVADYHLYPVADNDSPRLSADRLEYTLGNALNFGFLTAAQIRTLYEDLTVARNEEGTPELCFRHTDCALQFARIALACSKVYVSDEDRYSMQALCELLAEAISAGVLTDADLYGTEPALLEKLTASRLAQKWDRYCSLGRIFRAGTPTDDRPWRRIPAKKRRIDPLVVSQGRISALDPAFGAELRAFLEAPQTEWILACPAEPAISSCNPFEKMQ